MPRQNLRRLPLHACLTSGAVLLTLFMPSFCYPSSDEGPVGQFEYALEDVRISDAGEYDQIDFRGAARDVAPERAGSPQLPVIAYSFLLPPETRIDRVDYEVLDADTLDGTLVPVPIQDPQADGGGDTPPAPDIYDSPFPYPESPTLVWTDGDLRGYHVATVLIYPLRYVGSTQKLILLSRLRIAGTLRSLSADEPATFLPRHRPDFKPLSARGEVRWILHHVVNPGDLGRYYPAEIPSSSGDKSMDENRPFGGFVPTEFPSLEGPPVECVILTDSLDLGGRNVGDMVGQFQRIAGWNTLREYPRSSERSPGSTSTTQALTDRRRCGTSLSPATQSGAQAMSSSGGIR